METKILFVLAGSYREFKDFLREREGTLSLFDYRYAERPEKLMGYRGAGYITYGSFYKRDDAHQIEEAAKRYLPI